MKPSKKEGCEIMWLKKLKHKKRQFILAGVILFVSALIFSASLGFTVEVNRFAEEYYGREGLPNFFVFSGDERTYETIRGIFPNETLPVVKGFQLVESVGHNGEQLNGILTVYPLNDFCDLPWDFELKQGGTESRFPKQGEIWLPQVWADLKGVNVGDTLIIEGNVPFRVSALFNSYMNPSGMVSLFSFYINPDDMGLLPELPFAAISTLYIEGDYEETQAEIVAAVQGQSNVITIPKSEFIMSLSMMSTLLGGMGLLSAVLIFVVAVIIIRFMLRANLLKEYRSIGVYKAQGFSNRAIRGFYLKCYMFTGIISMGLGIIAGLPITAALCDSGIKYVGMSELSGLIIGLAVVSLLILFAVLVLNVFLATRPIKKITPVDALRIGMKSTREKFKRSLIKNASSPLSMAINDIAKHKSYSFMIVLILCVSFFLTLFSMSAMVTVNELENNTGAWFSLPNSDVYVTGRIDDDVVEFIRSNPDVEKMIVSEDLFQTAIGLDEMYDCSIQPKPFFFDDFSDLPYYEGRAPQSVNEVAMCNVILNDLDLKVGDYVSLIIGSGTGTFLITGSYQSMMNSGTTLYLLLDTLPAYNVEFTPGVLMITLKSGVSSESFIETLEQEFDGLLAEQTLSMIEDVIKSVKDMIVPITLILIIVFTIFSILNISNLVLQNHDDNRRQYGILKAFGFSTGYIAARNAWRIFILAIIAAVASLLIHISVSVKLFAAALNMNALDPAIPQTLLMLMGLMSLLMAITFLFCLPIRKITPLELMEE